MKEPIEDALELYGRMEMSKSGFFPIFLDVRNLNVIFFGGGNIASRRVGVLNGFDTRITVVAPNISDKLRAMIEAKEIYYIEDSFAEKYLEEADMVFACTDDAELNHRIVSLCRNKGIMVNNCSNRDECDFYFPGIVQKDNVVVGVNAGGNAHSQAKQIREKIKDFLNER